MCYYAYVVLVDRGYVCSECRNPPYLHRASYRQYRRRNFSMKEISLETRNCIACHKDLQNKSHITSGHVLVKIRTQSHLKPPHLIAVLARKCPKCQEDIYKKNTFPNFAGRPGCYGKWKEEYGITQL